MVTRERRDADRRTVQCDAAASRRFQWAGLDANQCQLPGRQPIPYPLCTIRRTPPPTPCLGQMPCVEVVVEVVVMAMVDASGRWTWGKVSTELLSCSRTEPNVQQPETHR